MRVSSASLVLLGLLCTVTVRADAAGPWRANERNTSGWAYMSPKERLEHQARVRAFKDHESCIAYRLRHHRDMQARAEAAGHTLKADHRDICEHLRPPPALP